MQRLQAWRGVLTGLFIGWLAGCGGGNSGSAGGGNTPAPVPSKLVGGSIQGNALSVQGTVSTFPGSGPAADGTGTTAHFYHPTGIATDGTNLYVADTYNNSIRRMVVATGMVTTLAGGTAGNAEGMGTAARFNHPSGIISDGTNLYVTDSDNNCIRQIVITTGKVTTLAGGTQGYADGTGSAARFDHPSGITSDGTNLYVADTYNTRIRQIVIASGVVTTLAGSTQGYAEGTGTAAQFYRPTGITLVGTSLYVTDSDINNIRQIVIASGVVTTLANTNNPTGITTDGINLYVTDSNHNGIRQIVIATKTVTPLAGSNIGSYGTANGTGGAAQFNTPSGITTDGTNLYVADSNNNLIRHIVISTATVTTSAGTASSYGTADGTGNAAQFESPNGLTTDGANLYMTDNHRIRQIGIASGSVTTLAGSPTGGYADGTGGAAQFYYPNGITTDGINLFVADSGNHRIRQSRHWRGGSKAPPMAQAVPHSFPIPPVSPRMERIFMWSIEATTAFAKL
ncbi:MAG: hypothetical protein HY080_04595 [Gammaproteobacteria bacterium]|nr:hypothetical protein [Gammaproteobacteria bacterium]